MVDLVVVVVLVGLDVRAVAAAVFSVCVVVVAGDRDDFAVVVSIGVLVLCLSFVCGCCC